MMTDNSTTKRSKLEIFLIIAFSIGIISGIVLVISDIIDHNNPIKSILLLLLFSLCNIDLIWSKKKNNNK